MQLSGEIFGIILIFRENLGVFFSYNIQNLLKKLLFQSLLGENIHQMFKMTLHSGEATKTLIIFQY